MSHTDTLQLEVHPICLGGNIFGWTIDEQESFAVLDAYADAGGNFVDTADVYSVWVDGHSGGESETIIGRWLSARGNRADMVVATKVGQLDGVGAQSIEAAVDASLRRLGTDYIDLYYTHVDDPEIPLEETLGALDALVRGGKVRQIGASGYTAARLSEALEISDREGLTRYAALQPQYILIERGNYENGLLEVCEREELACIPFFGLARGFLTGKYRPGADVDTKRGDFAWTEGFDDRSLAVLEALDDVSVKHGTTVAAVALAWLLAQPTVRAPIASARTVAQLRELLPAAELHLDSADLERLTEVSA
jgi:aryl-alcohol dehydrogenase-like predicted oxidoreductase